MAYQMALYTSEPEPGDPWKHELRAKGYERKISRDISFRIADEEYDFILIFRAKFRVEETCDITHYGMLTPGGDLIRAKPLRITLFPEAEYDLAYEIRLRIEE